MATFLAAREAMGTRFELVLLGPEHAMLQAAAEEVLEEVRRLEAQWSVYRLDSEISLVNRRAGREPVRVSARLMGLLQSCREFHEETAGAFDPAVGGLMEYWGFRGSAEAKDTGLREVLDQSGMSRVELDPVRRTVRFRDPGLRLDLGAVGKGAAVDAAVEILRAAGVTAGLLHAGTSTVYALGTPPGSAGWEIGVPGPRLGRAGVRASDLEATATTDLAARVVLRDAALGISAVWGRTIERGAESLGHVLDPRTGCPVAERWLSACVADTATAADALATGLLAGGPEVQAALARRRPGQATLLLMPDDNSDHGRVSVAGPPCFQTCLGGTFDV